MQVKKALSKRSFFNILIEIMIPVYMCMVFVLSFNTDTNVYARMMAVVLIGILGLYLLLRNRMVFDSFVGLLVVFWFFCLISCLWAWDSSIAFSKCISLFQLFLLIYLIYNYLVIEEKIDYFIACLCFSTTFFSIYTVFFFGVEEYFAGLEDGIRMGAEIANVNTVGVYAAMAVLVNLWYAFYRKKYWALILAVICAIVSMGSGSRKAIIALFVGMIFLFVATGNTKKRIKGIFVLICLLIGLLIALQLPIFETARERIILLFETMSGTHSGGSADIRFKMIDIGMEQFWKTPIGGIGIANAQLITLKELNWQTYLHNNYVELLSSVGIVGTVIYYSMYIVPMSYFVSKNKLSNPKVTLALVLLLVTLVLHYGMVAYTEKMEYMFIILFFLVVRDVKKEKEHVKNN